MPRSPFSIIFSFFLNIISGFVLDVECCHLHHQKETVLTRIRALTLYVHPCHLCHYYQVEYLSTNPIYLIILSSLLIFYV